MNKRLKSSYCDKRLNDVCGCLPKSLEKLALNGKNVLKYYDILVALIDSAFGVTTQLTKKPVGRILTELKTNEPIVKVTDPVQAIEISSYDIARVFDEYDGATTGFYDIPSGIIFLDQNRWCLNTLTHEALHSRSAFSKTILPKEYSFILEGITELFVGLTFKRNPLIDCYSEWHSIDQCFHDNYEEYVKLWHFLKFKIDFQPIEQLYFNQREENPIQRLGFLLETSGCKGCSDLLRRTTNTITLFQDFKDVLGQAFPKQFADFMSTDLRYTIDLAEL